VLLNPTAAASLTALTGLSAEAFGLTDTDKEFFFAIVIPPKVL